MAQQTDTERNGIARSVTSRTVARRHHHGRRGIISVAGRPDPPIGPQANADAAEGQR